MTALVAASVAGSLFAPDLVDSPGALTARRAPASAPLTEPVSQSLARILRPQAAYRWLLPQVAAMTPQYIEMVLRGALAGDHVRQWELFDLMLDTWPELAACSQELTLGVSRLKMIVEPFAEDDEDPTPSALERSKLVSSALRRMRPDAAADDNNLPGTLRDLCDAWFRGVTALEINWQSIESAALGTMIAPTSTFWVHPVCYAFGQDGRLGLRVDAKGQLSPANLGGASLQPSPAAIGEFPEHKFLIAIHKAKSGTALGSALLRPLAWWWCAANFSADWLLNLAQIFGLPFRWANYDPTAPQETVDRICSMLQNMGSAGWAAFPAGTTMELKDAGKGGDHSPQGELLDRADRYARLLILGQTQSGGKGSAVGSQAFGQVEANVKADRIDAAGDFACEVLNDQLIPSILALNYGDDDEAPTVRLLEDKEGDLEEAQRDETLAGAGLKIGVNFLRKKYKLPRPAEGEETIGGVVAPEPGAPKPGTPRKDEASLKAHAARLAAIEDDAVFARELQELVGTIGDEPLRCGFDTSRPGRWVTLEDHRHVYLYDKAGMAATVGEAVSVAVHGVPAEHEGKVISAVHDHDPRGVEDNEPDAAWMRAAAKREDPVSPEVASAIEDELRKRGVKYDIREHSAVNYDAAAKKYLPGKKTYSISLQLHDAATGQYSLKRISSVAEIEPALKTAAKELKESAARTRRFMKYERE